MPRDALWINASGVTEVVTVDDEGNRIDTLPAPDAPAAEPQPRKKGPQPRKQN